MGFDVSISFPIIKFSKHCDGHLVKSYFIDSFTFPHKKIIICFSYFNHFYFSNKNAANHLECIFKI